MAKELAIKHQQNFGKQTIRLHRLLIESSFTHSPLFIQHFFFVPLFLPRCSAYFVQRPKIEYWLHANFHLYLCCLFFRLRSVVVQSSTKINPISSIVRWLCIDANLHKQISQVNSSNNNKNAVAESHHVEGVHLSVV